MNIEKTISSYVAQFRSKGISNEVIVDEISLLFIWKYLVDKKPELKLPSLLDFATRGITLADAYSELNNKLDDKSEGFAKSVLPSILAPAEEDALIYSFQKMPLFSANELIRQLYDLVSKNSRATLNSSIPQELIELMIRVSNLNGEDVYAPWPASLQLAVEAKNHNSQVIFESEQHSSLSDFATLIADIEYIRSDPLMVPIFFKDGEIRKFENVVMIPPFGRKIKHKLHDRFSESSTNGDVLALEHGLSQCSGRLVALVPQGFLFRSGGADYDLRAKLVKKGIVECVIQLPASLLFNTALATTVLILDINRDPNAPVTIYDADQESLTKSGGRGRPISLTGWKQIAEDILNKNKSPYCKFVSKDEIIENKYDLSARRYVLGAASADIRKLENTKSLEQVSDIIRAQLLKEEKERQGEMYYEVGVRDISDDGIISEPEKNLLLSGRMATRAELQKLKPGDILLVSKGSVGKIGIVGDNCGNNWVASQSFQVVRLKHTKDITSPVYLFRYLTSPLVQAYLLEQLTGTTIPVLKTADIKELPVPIIPIEDQEAVLDTHRKILDSYNKIREIQNDIEFQRNTHWSLAK